jgi:CDP-ribitol ribitolphosphotransferase / teichoic acid ribitol-phosphate polymerase
MVKPMSRQDVKPTASFALRCVRHVRYYGLRFIRVFRKDPRRLPYHILSTVGYRSLYRAMCLIPVNKKKVFFASDRSSSMSDNFKYVYHEIKNRKLDFQYRFMLSNTQKKSLGQLARLAYHLATSKYIILDDFFFYVYGLTIRRDAELIQLWHAVGAFKRFGFSRVGRPGAASIKSKNHRNYTKAIVSSANVARHYAEAFGIHPDKVLATGVPRTDMLFDEVYTKRVRQEIYAELPQLKGKKVITYAPTFRGSGQKSADFDMDSVDLECLYNAFHDDYVFLWRMHPFIRNCLNIPDAYRDFFIDVSLSREMNDWLFVTDILVTDYSSVCFEAAILKIPMVFFAFDLEDYAAKRDFYYDYEQFIPGPIARTTTDLVSLVQSQAFQPKKIDEFVDYFFDQVDGKSSARVVDWIILGNRPEISAPVSAAAPFTLTTPGVASETAVSTT